MQFELLKKNHLKWHILIGVVVVFILAAVILTFTKAKYKATESIPLVTGTINYHLADLDIVALYINGEEVYELDSNSVYTLDTARSFCTYKDGSNITNLSINYNSETKGLSISPFTTKGTKCTLYFDELAYQWNRYSINSITTYIWNQYSLNSTISSYTTSYGGSGSITNSNGFTKIYVYQSTSAPRFDSDTGRVSSGLTSGNLDGISVGHWFTTRVGATVAYQYSGNANNGTVIYYSQSISSVPSYSYSQGSYLAQVTSQNNSAYPSNGISGNYWYTYQTSNTSYTRGSFIDVVSSVDENAYPNDDRLGDYWYVKLN